MPAEEIDKLTPPEAGLLASRFEELAEELRRVEQNGCDVWVFRKPSLLQARSRSESFLRELRRSLEACASGKPLSPTSKKTRGN